MKFVSTRELRNRPGLVRELAQEEELVLTANGKPVALLVGVAEGELEETARALRSAKAQRALSRLREHAARKGLDKLSSAQIQQEIAAARKQR